MNKQEFNQLCASFPHTAHVVQWGNSDVWKVAGKLFALSSVDKHQKRGFTFKCSETNFYFLSEKEGYRPAPYLASRGMLWIQQYDVPDSANLDEELVYYLKSSYNLVIQGFSKKKQKELFLLPIAV